MGIAFKKLFNVKMAHSFYEDGVTKDFDIVPLSRTQKILENNKLMFRFDNSGFRVMYRTKESSADPFFAFSNLELHFALVLKNTNEFLIFSELNESPTIPFKAGNLVYFKNNPASPTTANLSYSLIQQLQPAVFTYNFPQTSTSPTATGKLEVFNEAGANVTPLSPDPNTIAGVLDQNAPSAVYRFSYAIDFSKMPAGWYRFKTTVGADIKEQVVYIDASLSSSSVFGIIKITVNNAADSSFPTSRQYNANFIRRESYWRYVVVLQSGSVVPGDTVAVKDNGDDVLPPYAAYTFNAQGTGSINNIPTKIFESTAKIPFYQIAKKGLYVAKGTNPEVKVRENINNASWNRVSADVTDFEKTVIYVYV